MRCCPAPDDGDVFLDFEGHPLWRPDGGLFFLFGFLAQGEDGQWAYHARWAHDLDEERDAAEWLVDTLWERVQDHPGAHVHHYNHTERSGLQALFARHHLDDTRLGTMIREGVFVDLLEVVRNAVQIGAESYSLKEVERLTGYERRHDITKGSGAVVEYDGFMQRTAPDERTGADGASDDTLGRIAAYNEDDVARDDGGARLAGRRAPRRRAVAPRPPRRRVAGRGGRRHRRGPARARR